MSILYEIFNLLDDSFNLGKEIKILWYYAEIDEDIKELGVEYKNELNIPLELIKTPSEER